MARLAFWRKSTLNALRAHRVRLHTKDGHSIEGFLQRGYSDSLILHHAHYRIGPTVTEPLIGDTVVPIANVSFFQDVQEVAREVLAAAAPVEPEPVVVES